MANHALDNNPPSGDRHITTHASDWLWAVFAVMLLSFLGALLWNHSRKQRTRPFHHIPVIVLWVSTLTYFALASDLGYTLTRAEFNGQGTRQIWWVRYIQWFINAPLILLALMGLTGMLVSEMLTTMFFAWSLVIMGLVGALTRSSYKWGFYAFGVFSLLYLLYRLFAHHRRYGARSGYTGTRDSASAGANTGTGAGAGAGGGGKGISKRFYLLASWIALIWLLYPICWGLSEGGNRISPTSEMVFYGILDILSGPVFFFVYMIMFRGMDYWKLGSGGGDSGAGAGGLGAGTGAGAGMGGANANAAGTGSGAGGYGANAAGGAPAANFGEKRAAANGNTQATGHV